MFLVEVPELGSVYYTVVWAYKTPCEKDYDRGCKGGGNRGENGLLVELVAVGVTDQIEEFLKL